MTYTYIIYMSCIYVTCIYHVCNDTYKQHADMHTLAGCELPVPLTPFCICALPFLPASPLT